MGEDDGVSLLGERADLAREHLDVSRGELLGSGWVKHAQLLHLGLGS
jgi:hypothetical protein